MSAALRRRLSTTALTAVLALAGSVLVSPAQAATKPPPASQLKLYSRTDHTLAIQFAVPAAYYHPGAGAVVRLTGGRTPAATPTSGYAATADGRHVARPASSTPLRANQDYTFAVWIRDHGVYSKRAAITVRTLKDTTRPDPVTHLSARAGIGDGTGRVVLSWTGSRGDDIDYVRIVRNTKPGTTGGTVVNTSPGAQAYTDDTLPASVRSGAGFTSAPLYYYVIERDRAGNFSVAYAGTQVVVGSRTLSGTYQGTNRFESVWGAPGFTGVPRLVASKHGTAIPDGTFSFLVPPGVYTVCDASNGATPNDIDQSAACWEVRSDGSTNRRPWPTGYDEDVAGPSIDVSRDDYTSIAFTGAPSGS